MGTRITELQEKLFKSGQTAQELTESFRGKISPKSTKPKEEETSKKRETTSKEKSISAVQEFIDTQARFAADMKNFVEAVRAAEAEKSAKEPFMYYLQRVAVSFRFNMTQHQFHQAVASFEEIANSNPFAELVKLGPVTEANLSERLAEIQIIAESQENANFAEAIGRVNRNTTYHSVSNQGKTLLDYQAFQLHCELLDIEVKEGVESQVIKPVQNAMRFAMPIQEARKHREEHCEEHKEDTASNPFIGVLKTIGGILSNVAVFVNKQPDVKFQSFNVKSKFDSGVQQFQAQLLTLTPESMRNQIKALKGTNPTQVADALFEIFEHPEMINKIVELLNEAFEGNSEALGQLSALQDAADGLLDSASGLGSQIESSALAKIMDISGFAVKICADAQQAQQRVATPFANTDISSGVKQAMLTVNDAIERLYSSARIVESPTRKSSASDTDSSTNYDTLGQESADISSVSHSSSMGGKDDVQLRDVSDAENLSPVTAGR